MYIYLTMNDIWSKPVIQVTCINARGKKIFVQIKVMQGMTCKKYGNKVGTKSTLGYPAINHEPHTFQRFISQGVIMRSSKFVGLI